MPLYEYHCSDCQSAFETLRPMSQADDPIPCAHCGSEHTSRVLSVFATIGTGRATASDASSGCGGCSGGDCSHCGH
jgi:putative FmdB family regulatory protein